MNETVYILGYDDYASGNAYMSEQHIVELPEAFTAALQVVRRHDHACIIDEETLVTLKARDFYTVAPHSINISLGIYAQETKL